MTNIFSSLADQMFSRHFCTVIIIDRDDGDTFLFFHG